MNSVDHITVPILPMLPNARESQLALSCYLFFGQRKQHSLYVVPLQKEAKFISYGYSRLVVFLRG